MMSRWLGSARDSRGNLQLTLSAKGISADGAAPWQGRNAIELLIEDLERVRRCFLYARSAGEDRISLNIGVVYGGTAVGTVPNQAYAKLNFSIPYPLSVEQVKKRIKGALKYCSFAVESEYEASAEPQDLPYESALLSA